MPRPPRAGKGAEALLTVKLTTAEMDAYRAAAASLGLDLSTFVRLALDAAILRGIDMGKPNDP